MDRMVSIRKVAVGDGGGSDCACFAPLPFGGAAQRGAGSAPGLARVPGGQVSVMAERCSKLEELLRAPFAGLP